MRRYFHQIPHDYGLAMDQARKATRRGDAAATERWTRIAQRHLATHQVWWDLHDRAVASPNLGKPTGPLMLDPKGFSPGGEPNWYLNRKRRERAGLK